MIIEPGDKLEIFLTHKGVPYAKTFEVDRDVDLFSFTVLCANMADALYTDIENHGDEHET